MEALQRTIRRIALGQAIRGSDVQKVPTDEVISPFFFDDTPLYRNAVSCWKLRFNNVLDGDKLHAALARLLEMEGWRKLGGRFRLNSKDKLEIHIPQSFTDERPAVNYSHKSFDISIGEHPQAASYPDVTEGTESFHVPHGRIADLGLPDSIPRCLEDYLKSDSPQLSLHVVNFTDATLVMLCWPHLATDAIGLRTLAKAWNLVLAGREAEVPRMLSFRDDPLATAGCDAKFQERHFQEDIRLKRPWLILWAMRYLLDTWFWPKMEPSGVVLSREAVRKLKEAAIASLPEEEGGGKHFISTGDVISAWIASMTASVLPSTSRRSVVISNAMDLRDRAPSLFRASAEQGVYVQNALLPVSAVVPAQDLFPKEGGLGRAALAVRKSVDSQGQEGQLHALARLDRRSLAEAGIPPVFGDTSSFFVILSNWSKVQIFDNVDFGPAVVTQQRPGDPLAVTESKPVYYKSEYVSKDNAFGRNSLLFTETPSGGCCIDGYLPPEIWRKIGDALRCM